MALDKRSNKALADHSRRRAVCRVSGRPYCLMIEPTNTCNLHCPLCPTGAGTLQRPKGFLEWPLFRQVADELAPYLYRADIWGFGEPTLHPDLPEMIRYLEQRDVRVTISTNGCFFANSKTAVALVESGLTGMRISLDGASQESYRKYRKGGHFKDVVEGLRAIQAIKRQKGLKSPRIMLQFIVMRHNEHEIELMKQLAASFQVELRLKSVSLEAATEQAAMPADSRISRYVAKEGELAPRHTQPETCPYPWLWATICWDGSVVPCCKDPHGEHFLGKVTSTTPFHEIWMSSEFVTFREKHVVDRAGLTRCRRCALPVAQEFDAKRLLGENRGWLNPS